MFRRRSKLTLLGLLCVLVSSNSVDAHVWPTQRTETLRALTDGTLEERREAARRLVELSPATAKKAVRKALGDTDAEVRSIAAHVARAFGYHDLGDVVVDWLTSQDTQERIEALRLLALAPDEQSLGAIEAACTDAERSVRKAAAVALGSVPTSLAARASSKLLSLLDDPEAEVRVEAAASLGKLGDVSAVLTLAAHLQDPDPEVRVQVALALGALGSEDAVAALLVALSDSQDTVVAAVATSLGELRSEQAVLGLVSVAESSPHRASGREALKALLGLSSSAAARKAVLNLLGTADHGPVLRALLSEARSEASELLEECVRTFAGDTAEHCAEGYLRAGGKPELVLNAQNQGRLSAAQALSLFEGRPHHGATILALETLSSHVPRDEPQALAYLLSAGRLAIEAQGPIVEALQARARPPHELVLLLHALGLVEGGPHGVKAETAKVLKLYLKSTMAEVKSAAATTLAARGLNGAQLRELLLSETPLAQGALSGLAMGMTAPQAETVIQLYQEGTSGRQKALLSVFSAMPGGLSPEAGAALIQMFRRSRFADRDAFLYPLVRSFAIATEKRLLAHMSREDLLKVAQLGWYEPKALGMMRKLSAESDAHVAASAARAVGRHGTSDDALLLARLAQSNRPFLVRAAALEGLSFMVLRGVQVEIDDKVLSAKNCASEHDLHRAQALRLAAALGRSCADRPLEDVLSNDRDPRMRRLAAILLRHSNPTSSALGRCAIYESRREIAEICRRREEPFPFVESRRTAPPYRIQQVQARGSPVVVAPVMVRASGSALGSKNEGYEFGLRLMTDRAGHVLVPRQSGELVDSNWYF